jgi:uncharacterized protein (TIRG00374 family)
MIPSATVTRDNVSPSTSTVPRRFVGATIGLAVSLVALYFALRGIDGAAVARSLRGTNPAPLVIAVGLAASSSLVRALRWRALFSEKTVIPLRYYFTSMMIGYLGNNVLPARAGDVIRAVLFGKRTDAGISMTAATLVVERVIDASTLLAIVGVVSFLVPLPPVLSGAARLASVACFVALAVLIAIAFRGRVRTDDQAVDHNRIRGLMTRFVEGLHALQNARSLVVVLALTGTIWLIESAMVFFVMRASGLPLPPLAALFVLVVVSLGLLIPAGPASIGSYELFVILGLSAFAVEKTQALSAGIVLHSVAFLTATTIGLICLWIEGVSFRTLQRGER